MRLTKIRKRVHSLNLHSFIDQQSLRDRDRNSIYIKFIEDGAKKIRFTLYFIFSIMHERKLSERILFSMFNLPENEFFFSGNDIEVLLEDCFQFLELFIINPLTFFEKMLTFLYLDCSAYHNCFHEDLLRNLFRDYISSTNEKQLVITVGNFKYELYKFKPEVSYEENITKTIHKFPTEDPVDILGFSLNNEFQLNYYKSLEAMKFLRDFYQSQAKLQDKSDIEDQILNLMNSEKKVFSSDNFALKYENILYLLQEINVANPLKHRLKLLETILQLFKEDLPMQFVNSEEVEEPYIEEDTIREWFGEKSLYETNEDALKTDNLEVITFKKLNLSLKRNTSVKTSVRRMSRLFPLKKMFLNVVEEVIGDSKMALLENKSKFSNKKGTNLSLNNTNQEVSPYLVYFLKFN